MFDARIGQHPFVIARLRDAEGGDRERQETEGEQQVVGVMALIAASATTFQRRMAYIATAKSADDISAASAGGASP